MEAGVPGVDSASLYAAAQLFELLEEKQRLPVVESEGISNDTPRHEGVKDKVLNAFLKESKRQWA